MPRKSRAGVRKPHNRKTGAGAGRGGKFPRTAAELSAQRSNAASSPVIQEPHPDPIARLIEEAGLKRSVTRAEKFLAEDPLGRELAAKGFTVGEIAALNAYQVDSFAINTALRSGRESKFSPIADTLSVTIRKLEASGYGDPAKTTYRGERTAAKTASRYPENSIITLAAPLSTSTDKRYAASFGGSAVTIKKPAGAGIKLDRFTHIKGEDEILFPAGTKFRASRSKSGEVILTYLSS